jgi:hypothetical protein
MTKNIIKSEININGNKVNIIRIGNTDYVSLTD